MDDSEEDTTSPATTDLDLKTREKILDNEMRSFKNRGFHDGYTDGKKAIIQDSFDNGYKKAFEQNFILSTLKGVANALQSSYNLSNINISSNHLSKLESMKFDNAGDIESIKEDLIKICRENRLEILAHYVSTTN